MLILCMTRDYRKLCYVERPSRVDTCSCSNWQEQSYWRFCSYIVLQNPAKAIGVIWPSIKPAVIVRADTNLIKLRSLIETQGGIVAPDFDMQAHYACSLGVAHEMIE